MTIQLYYFPTPNGRKISIALEEMGLDYEVVMANISKARNRAQSFCRSVPMGVSPDW
jgi:GSH-dependent disulfide-bond oxidoreductase